MPGEISILIDGRYPAQSRVILQEGTSHYSMEFILPDKDMLSKTLYTAQVTLRTGGKINDTAKQQFTVSDLSAEAK